jgi:hypothetical protein
VENYIRPGVSQPPIYEHSFDSCLNRKFIASKKQFTFDLRYTRLFSESAISSPEVGAKSPSLLHGVKSNLPQPCLDRGLMDLKLPLLRRLVMGDRL